MQKARSASLSKRLVALTLRHLRCMRVMRCVEMRFCTHGPVMPVYCCRPEWGETHCIVNLISGVVGAGIIWVSTSVQYSMASVKKLVRIMLCILKSMCLLCIIIRPESMQWVVAAVRMSIAQGFKKNWSTGLRRFSMPLYVFLSTDCITGRKQEPRLLPYIPTMRMGGFLRFVVASGFELECIDETDTVLAKVHTPDLRVVFAGEYSGRLLGDFLKDKAELIVSPWDANDPSTARSLVGNARISASEALQ